VGEVAMRILLIDNYDSFTYNLAQLLGTACQCEQAVMRHDDPALRTLDPGDYDCIVISPGPGRPQHEQDLGWCSRLLAAHPQLPVLGVCLGHQAIAHAAGALVREGQARHGFIDRVRHDGAGLFAGLPQGFAAVRYHSLQVAAPLPGLMQATAWAADGTIMGIRHRELLRWGVQFHPESVATEHGVALVRNFASLVRQHRAVRVGLALAGLATGPATDPSGPAGAQANPVPVPSREAAAAPVPASPAWTQGGAARAAASAARTQDPTAPVPASPARTQDRATPLPARAAAAPVGGQLRDIRELRVTARMIRRAVDGAQAFAALYRASPVAFWLDGGQPGPCESRFSFLGDDSGPLAERLTYRVGSGQVVVSHGGGTSREAGTIFDALGRRLAGRTVRSDDLPFAFNGGYVGYLGYELKADCGGSQAWRSSLPDACWLFADRLVVIDHAEDRSYVVTVSDTRPGVAEANRAWADHALAVLRRLGPPRPELIRPASPRLASMPAGARLARDRDQYLADVGTCLAELRRGESYEICLTSQITLPPVADPHQWYLLIRRSNPAPYGAYLRFGELAVLSSSPESFLRIGADQTVRARPIKGTAARDASPAADARLRRSVLSAKNQAENLMITDLLRNDLGKVCEVGSVTVPSYLAVESYATVHQLVSTIAGRLRPGVRAVDCARECFPSGSMTGAPKIRTMQIIDRIEGGARGVYSGALGYFGLGGGAELSVVIRTAVAGPAGASIGTGGAIVLDSDPAAEFAEAMAKAYPLLRAYQLYGRPARVSPAAQ
jgi:para-aminobenzoate synthetase